MLFDFLYKKIRADDMSFILDATKKKAQVCMLKKIGQAVKHICINFFIFYKNALKKLVYINFFVEKRICAPR
jgi:hypothetical protein